MSSRSTSVGEIMLRFEGPDVLRRETGETVWDIVDPPALARDRASRVDAIEACKRELLAALASDQGPTFIRHADDPREESVPGEWRPAAPSTWFLPRDIDLDDQSTRQWLFGVGGWSLYQGDVAIEFGWPDVARSTTPELLDWMQANEMHVLIDSFHDDVSWVVAVRSAQDTRAGSA